MLFHLHLVQPYCYLTLMADEKSRQRDRQTKRKSLLFCRLNKTRDVEYLEQFTGFTSEHTFCTL